MSLIVASLNTLVCCLKKRIKNETSLDLNCSAASYPIKLKAILSLRKNYWNSNINRFFFFLLLWINKFADFPLSLTKTPEASLTLPPFFAFSSPRNFFSSCCNSIAIEQSNCVRNTLIFLIDLKTEIAALHSKWATFFSILYLKTTADSCWHVTACNQVKEREAQKTNNKRRQQRNNYTVRNFVQQLHFTH